MVGGGWWLVVGGWFCSDPNAHFEPASKPATGDLLLYLGYWLFGGSLKRVHPHHRCYQETEPMPSQQRLSPGGLCVNLTTGNAQWPISNFHLNPLRNPRLVIGYCTLVIGYLAAF